MLHDSWQYNKLKSVVDSISELNTNSLTNCRPYWRHVSLTDCMPPLVEARLSHRLHAAPSGGTSLSQTAVPSGGNSDMSLSLTTAPIIIVEACLSHKILPLSGGYSDMSLLYVHMVSCMFLSSLDMLYSQVLL